MKVPTTKEVSIIEIRGEGIEIVMTGEAFTTKALNFTGMETFFLLD